MRLLITAVCCLLSGCALIAPRGFTDVDGLPSKPLAVGEAKANVLVFVTTHCPIANAYAPEIQSIVRDYETRGVQFFLIHADPEVTDRAARAHAEEHGHMSTIVVDRNHELVRATGVTTTPEAVLLNGAGEIVYRGRIDNWFGDAGSRLPEPTKRDLRDAIEAVLAGRPIMASRTDAVGCDLPEF